MLTDAPLGLLIKDSARLLRARFDKELDRAQLGLTAGEARAFVYISRYEASPSVPTWSETAAC
jgi:MarR family transcriptional regulator for hemolysin